MIARLVAATEGYSGAETVMVCREAAMGALKRATVIAAASQGKPTTPNEDQQPRPTSSDNRPFLEPATRTLASAPPANTYNETPQDRTANTYNETPQDRTANTYNETPQDRTAQDQQPSNPPPAAHGALVAATLAAQGVQWRDFEVALTLVRPRISKQLIRFYREYQHKQEPG
eukprot:GHVT01088568.1.p1 GENE.GHVT01088568.1~~GHVT01088568.1.p1  ORF type:complete len:173 (+),score=30.27 GHVT01088568.1:328-846(+)